MEAAWVVAAMVGKKLAAAELGLGEETDE